MKAFVVFALMVLGIFKIVHATTDTNRYDLPYRYLLKAGVYKTTPSNEENGTWYREFNIYRALPVQPVTTEDKDAITETKKWRNIVAIRRQIKNQRRIFEKIKAIHFEIKEATLSMEDLAHLALASEGISEKKRISVTFTCDAWVYDLGLNAGDDFGKLVITYAEMGTDCASNIHPRGFKLAFVPKEYININKDFHFFNDEIKTYEMLEHNGGKGSIRVSYRYREYVAPDTMRSVGDYGYIEIDGKKSKIIYRDFLGYDMRIGSRWLDGIGLYSENGHYIKLSVLGPSGARDFGAEVTQMIPSATQRFVESIQSGRNFEIDFREWTTERRFFYITNEEYVPLNNIN